MVPIETVLYPTIFMGLYFAVFIIGTFFENRGKIYKNPKAQEFPSVCLIVPCFNEEENIERTLISLTNLDYPKEKLEVIVVDDGSRDKTFQKAKELAAKNEKIKVFRKDNGGKYTALNLGVKATKAEFVGSVDADSYLEPEAVKKIMSYFDNPKTMAVISTVKISQVKNTLEGIQYVEYLMAAFLRKIFSLLDSVNVTPGPLSIFRKEVFETLGPYRKAHHTEDLELAFRLQKADFKIAHAVDAVVYTQPCPNFKTLFRQRLRWRRGFLLNLRDYPDLLNLKRHGHLSLLLFYSLLGSSLSIILTGYTLYRLGDFILGKINQLFLVGIDFSQLFSFNFDTFLFSFNIRPSLALGIVSLLAFFVYLSYSKKLTFDSKPIKKDVVSYLVLYVFLNAIWWVSAVFSAVFKKEHSW